VNYMHVLNTNVKSACVHLGLHYGLTGRTPFERGQGAKLCAQRENSLRALVRVVH
jgi:hypothetical protein